MAKETKQATDVSRETLTDIPSVNTSTAPVMEQNDLIKPNHIGIILKGGTGHIGQVHKSMRHIYDNDQWTIIEPKQKKTPSIPDRADKEIPAQIVTNK